MTEWFTNAPTEPTIPDRLRRSAERWRRDEDGDRYRHRVSDVFDLPRYVSQKLRADAERHVAEWEGWWERHEAWKLTQPYSVHLGGFFRFFDGKPISFTEAQVIGLDVSRYIVMARDGADEATLRKVAGVLTRAVEMHRAAVAAVREAGFDVGHGDGDMPWITSK
jgi:hypothetical protein